MAGPVRPANPLTKPGPGTRVLKGKKHVISKKREGFDVLGTRYDVSPRAIIEHNMKSPGEKLTGGHLLWYMQNWWGLKPPNYIFKGGEVLYIPGFEEPKPELQGPVVFPKVEHSKNDPIANFRLPGESSNRVSAARTAEQSWNAEGTEIFYLSVIVHDARAIGGTARVRLVNWDRIDGRGPKKVIPMSKWFSGDGPFEAVEDLPGYWLTEMEVPCWGWYEVEVKDSKGRLMYRRKLEGGVGMALYVDEDPSRIYNLIILDINPVTVEQTLSRQLDPWRYFEKSVGEEHHDLLSDTGVSWDGIRTVSPASERNVPVQIGLVTANTIIGTSKSRATEAVKDLDDLVKAAHIKAEKAKAIADLKEAKAAGAAADASSTSAKAGKLTELVADLEKLEAKAASEVSSWAQIVDDFKANVTKLEELDEAIEKASKTISRSRKVIQKNSTNALKVLHSGRKTSKLMKMSRTAGRKVLTAQRDLGNATKAMKRLVHSRKLLIAAEGSLDFQRKLVASAIATFAEHQLVSALLSKGLTITRGSARVTTEAAGDAARRAHDAQQVAKSYTNAAKEADSIHVARVQSQAVEGAKAAKLAKLGRAIDIVGSLIGIGVTVYVVDQGITGFYDARRKFRQAIRELGDYPASAEQIAHLEGLRITADHLRSNYEIDAGMALFDIAGLIPNPFCQAISKIGLAVTLLQLGSDYSKDWNLVEKNFGDSAYLIDAWDYNWEALVQAYNAWQLLKNMPFEFHKSVADGESQYNDNLFKDYGFDYSCSPWQEKELLFYLHKEYQYRLRTHLMYLIRGASVFKSGELGIFGDLDGFLKKKVFKKGARVEANANVSPSLVEVFNWNWGDEHQLLYWPDTDYYAVDFMKYFPIDKWIGSAARFKAWYARISK